MFPRKPEATEEDTTVLPTGETPVRTDDDTSALPRWRQPSSFATRKARAEADADAGMIRSTPRVVSLGETEFTQRNNKTGEIEVLGAELFYDIDHPMKRWIEIDGVPGRHPLQSSDVSSRDQVKPLPPIKGRHFGGMSNLTTPSVAEPPPRPV